MAGIKQIRRFRFLADYHERFEYSRYIDPVAFIAGQKAAAADPSLSGKSVMVKLDGVIVVCLHGRSIRQWIERNAPHGYQ